MNTKAELGKQGEEQAAEYLSQKGYEIVARNYRYKRSEIDLICKHENLLIFIEVKAKSYVSFGEPELSVDEKKSAKVIEGAEHYIHDTNWQSDIRFDVISIVKSKGRFEIIHFEDAFY
ncbi:MAG: YraN family protein [Fulvivirga sp.]|uniref:YraN family protein n=1 Tax=Fulvivirga sp. TaxID=1931237 RepID=UPI0032EAA8F9